MYAFIVGMLYDNPTGDEVSDEAAKRPRGLQGRSSRIDGTPEADRPGRGLSL